MSEAAELEMLQCLVPELEADGYEVYIQPNKPLIPAFLGDFSPDAVALREDKNLVVEVLRQSPEASKKLERVTTLLHGQKKWALRVVWVNPPGNQKTLQVQAAEAIRARILEIRQIAKDGHIESALLMAWATFEALARALLTNQFKRPQTPGRLIQVLASEGYLTPTEADRLRALAEKRNSLIHGELQVRVPEKELQDFASVLETMLQQMPR